MSKEEEYSDKVLKKLFGIDCKKETKFEKVFPIIILILLVFSVTIGIISLINLLI